MGKLLQLNPSDLEPVHEANVPNLLAELVEDMTENGWTGRPLLVFQCRAGFQAWTGSHRIAAARITGLPEVPCYVLPESLLRRVENDPIYPPVLDRERLALIRKLGDKEATDLTWREGTE